MNLSGILRRSSIGPIYIPMPDSVEIIERAADEALMALSGAGHAKDAFGALKQLPPAVLAGGLARLNLRAPEALVPAIESLHALRDEWRGVAGKNFARANALSMDIARARTHLGKIFYHGRIPAPD
jgi:hypothetical protein